MPYFDGFGGLVHVVVHILSLLHCLGGDALMFGYM